MKYNCCGRPTPILPTAYTEALSYGETLGKVITKVNECVDEVNENDKKVDDLTNLVGTFDNRITENTNNIAAEQAARKDEDAKLTTELNDVKSTITTLEGNIDDNTSAISKETEDRELADNELLTAINKEVNDRKLADSEIKEYVNNNCANAVKGNVTSIVVSVSDVSPLEHNVKVKVSSPTIDLTTVQVTRSGKNVFDAVNATKVSGASSFTNTNGVITVTQDYAGNWASANVPLSPGLVGSTITITCKSVVSGVNKAGVRVQWITSAGSAAGDIILGNPDGDGNIAVTGVVPSQPDASHNTLCLMLYSNTDAALTTGTTYTTTYSNIQIEIGRTATTYTPYQGQTYKPKADGTVLGVTSISPYMTLMTNTTGIVLDVTYNKDINSNLGGDISATGNNIFTGTNTFNGRVLVPTAPATNNDVANKLYVDNHSVTENTVQSIVTPISINKTSYAIFGTTIVFYDSNITLEEEDVIAIVTYYSETLGIVTVSDSTIHYTNLSDLSQKTLAELEADTALEPSIWIISNIEF